MSFLISEALAEAPAAAAPPGGELQFIFFMVFIAAVFYFMIIRPQTKRAKEHRNMLNEMGKGDEVVTTGGILGKVTQVGENFVSVEVSKGMIVQVQKQAIASLMPKGTIKLATP